MIILIVIMKNFLPDDFNSLNPLHLWITLAWQGGLDLSSGIGVLIMVIMVTIIIIMMMIMMIIMAWQAGLDLLSGNGVGIIRIFSLGIRVVFSGIGMSLILAFSYKSLFDQKDLHSRHNDVS